MRIDKFIGLAAIFFYALCWFAEQPEKWIWYIGVGLPWFSLIATIIIYFIFRPDVKDEEKFLGAVYVVMCIVYMVATSIMTGSVIQQTPYLACCVCFIASIHISMSDSKLIVITEEYGKLHEKDLVRDCYIKSLIAQNKDTQRQLNEIAFMQEENIDEPDEVIRIAHSRVILKKMKTMLDELSNTRKINEELYN